MFKKILLIIYFFLFAAQEMVEKDFSLLIGLSVALTVFLVVSLTSIRILRRKGRSPSMYTMTNLSKQLFPILFLYFEKALILLT